jgi:uncharacterized membrane protein (UPF0182 family)
MLATRELSADKLPAEAQRWVNRRLQFTHGYGVAMSPVTEVEAGGRPSFFISDVPPVGVIPLERPEIYYGLQSLDHVIARSGMRRRRAELVLPPPALRLAVRRPEHPDLGRDQPG